MWNINSVNTAICRGWPSHVITFQSSLKPGKELVQKSEDRQRAGPPSWLTADWSNSIERKSQGLCLFRSGSSQDKSKMRFGASSPHISVGVRCLNTLKTLFKIVVAGLMVKALNHNFGGYLFRLASLSFSLCCCRFGSDEFQKQDQL